MTNKHIDINSMGQGKTALVTGARRGIGTAIAKALLDCGYFVFLSAASEELGGGFDAYDGALYAYIPCDISDAQQRVGLFARIAERRGRLDVLVNNAGVAPAVRTDILQLEEHSYDRVMDVNAKGTFFMCQAGAALMLQTRVLHPESAPKIINLSSISAYTASVERGEYCISKAAISMTTKLFAARLAGEGIAVFELRPGVIMTDMTRGVQEKYQRLIDSGLTPVPRFGQPEDVANTVLAACSGLLDFSAGQVLCADGGFDLRRL